MAAAVVAALLLVVSGCASREGDDIGSPIFNGTTPDGLQVEPPITTLPIPEIDAIRVPLDFFSVQNAVDAAQPGDLILLDPGVYTEEISITTPDIVVRGRDRNSVFIDGLHSATTGITVLADGVAIENLTVRNYLGDGIVVQADSVAVPRNRFRALHVTTSNTGENGINLENTTNAEIRQGWLSGHGAAGVQVTDCANCATLVTTTLVEFSARGFSVSGGMGGVSIFSSTSRNNRTGVVVEDGPTLPSTDVLVAANLVLNNGFTTSPSTDPLWDTSFGTGVFLGGTVGTEVVANRVEGNTRSGIVLSQTIGREDADPIATRLERNETSGHVEGDIVLALLAGVADAGLCIRDNVGSSIAPQGAAEAARCGAENSAPPLFEWTGETRSTIPYPNGPVPPGIDGMAEADVAPPIPAGPVVSPDVSSAVVPTA